MLQIVQKWCQRCILVHSLSWLNQTEYRKLILMVSMIRMLFKVISSKTTYVDPHYKGNQHSVCNVVYASTPGRHSLGRGLTGQELCDTWVSTLTWGYSQQQTELSELKEIGLKQQAQLDLIINSLQWFSFYQNNWIFMNTTSLVNGPLFL